MYPIDLYRTIHADRRTRLRRLAGSPRHASPRARPESPRPDGRPVTVAGPSGDVVLSPRGVTRLDGGQRRDTSHSPARR